MTKKILAVLLVGIMVLGLAACGTVQKDEEDTTNTTNVTEVKDAEDGILNVLMIGNSFSSYYVEELYGLAEAAGIDMAVYNVYASGCPVSEHREWLDLGAKGYEFYVTDSLGKRKVSELKVGLEECLAEANWDVISLQSGRQQTRQDYQSLLTYNLADAKYLYDYLREKAPQARLLWHHAWEYEIGYTKEYGLESEGDTAYELHAVPNRANQILRHEINHDLGLRICKENNVEMVPTGDAWDMLRAAYYPQGVEAESITSSNLGDYKYLCGRPSAKSVTRETLMQALEHGDKYHDGDVGGGQYLNACVWFEVLTGQSCVGNTYVPTYTYEGTTYEMHYDASILQEYAHKAVEAMKDPNYYTTYLQATAK